MGQELSDCLLYLVRLADVCHVDLGAACLAKIQVRNIGMGAQCLDTGLCARMSPCTMHCSITRMLLLHGWALDAWTQDFLLGCRVHGWSRSAPLHGLEVIPCTVQCNMASACIHDFACVILHRDCSVCVCVCCVCRPMQPSTQPTRLEGLQPSTQNTGTHLELHSSDMHSSESQTHVAPSMPSCHQPSSSEQCAYHRHEDKDNRQGRFLQGQTCQLRTLG